MTEFVSAPPPIQKRAGGFALTPYRQSTRITRVGQFADDLRANPGKWGVYPGDLYSTKSAYSTTGNINRGLTRSFQPRGAFQAMTRTDRDGTRVLVQFKEDVE